jgi:hypothetical protein
MSSPLVTTKGMINGVELEFALTNRALYKLQQAHGEKGEPINQFITRLVDGSDLGLTAEMVAVSCQSKTLTADNVLDDVTLTPPALLQLGIAIGMQSLGIGGGDKPPLVENPVE